MPSLPSFLLREARRTDHRQILRLARELDSTSLPTDADELAELLQCSKASFAGKIRDRSRARYVFAAEEIRSRRIVAVSMIIGKHGTPSSPHYYFEVAADERYSHSLKRMFRHTYLRLRYSMDGPTEIGGLIVSPAARGHPERIGKQISWVRFLYIARNRRRFEKDLLAEMLPTTLPGHGNHFWDHYGRRVTGLSYKQADRLSTRDKEFIRALFPDAPIYVLMLPEEIRSAIGEVGVNTRGALRILEQAGMRYLNQIDPFDGGPYYGARVDEIAPIKSHARYQAIAGTPDDSARFMVARHDTRGFRAVASIAQPRKRQIILPAAVLNLLKVRPSDQVDVTPLDGPLVLTKAPQHLPG